MLSKPNTSKADLFRSRLDSIIDMNHSIVRLSFKINWASFTVKFGSLYHEHQGRPGLPIRLMVGLTYLSRMHDLSDEAVLEQWLENPYWQYFCGYEYFQHKLPMDPSSLVRWRKRIGVSGVEFLLQQTIVAAQKTKQLKTSHLNHVNIDTTVQEKAITFPTDAKLYHRMLERLVSEAKRTNIRLRQSYVRKSKQTLQMQGRYSHARQMKRARKETRSLKTYLRRVVGDIRRKCTDLPKDLTDLLLLADRLLLQQKDSKGKLYSVHASEVECIAKGKSHKRYEFGSKVSVATTSRDNWIIGIQAHHGNPWDGHTLGIVIDQIKRLAGKAPGKAYCDRGYRGHDYDGDTEIKIVGGSRKHLSRWERMWYKRRSAIEPIIGHLKSDNRMDRNRLKGKDGDMINAMLAGCGRNLRKLQQILFLLFRILFNWFQKVENRVVFIKSATPIKILRNPDQVKGIIENRNCLNSE